MLLAWHKQLLNDFQRDFPLSPRPYQDIAQRLGVTEADVLHALSEASELQTHISRIGPVIRPNHIGISTLVALSVPNEQLPSIADQISRYPEVNHNYEREHHLNLWFVVIAADAEHLSGVLEKIAQETGYQPLQLPLLNDFFIDLGFQMDLQDAG